MPKNHDSVEMTLDIEIDDELEMIEEVKDIPAGEVEKIVTMDDEIKALIDHHHKQANAYTDVRMSKMMDNLKKQQAQLDSHTKQLGTITSTVNTHTEMLTALNDQQTQILQLLQNKPVLDQRPIKQVNEAQPTAIPAAQPQAQQYTPAQLIAMLAKQNEPKKQEGIVGNTLGTVGGVLHGVVDTAAFIAESAVDLITFGKAKRDHGDKENPHAQTQIQAQLIPPPQQAPWE